MNSSSTLPEDLSTAHQIISIQATRITELESQVKWFKKQIFGPKTEQRRDDSVLPILGTQSCLGESVSTESLKPKTQESPVPIEQKKDKSSVKKRALIDDCGESGLRFDSTVPVKEIVLPCAEIEGLKEDEYEVIGEKITERLAVLPKTHMVLRYRRPVVKIKETQKIVTVPAPASVIEGSYTDVSLLVWFLIEKFLYHQPLYRLHQKIEAQGILLSRTTLTNLVHQCGDLLEPVYKALVCLVVASKVLAMDETRLKVKLKDKKGLKFTYFWPVYGDNDEVIFPWSTSRGSQVIHEVLGEDFKGVLLTDGYSAYDKYAAKVSEMTHANCWTHARREFIEAEELEPEAAKKAIAFIRVLYENEDEIRKSGLEGKDKHEYRTEHSKPVVDEFFAWLKATQRSNALLPSNEFGKAATYALSRETALRVFLSDPEVPIDTNHLERTLRVIPMGRKNWLFCMTEVGAKYVGIFQSLIVTCKLQGVNPYEYLVDVLQRIKTVTNQDDISLLTPRLWKEHYAQGRLGSDIEEA